MPEIPDIGVRDINIREIKPNPIFDLGTPRILVPSPPVTTYLRNPLWLILDVWNMLMRLRMIKR
jgi:hypothetical protein